MIRFDIDNRHQDESPDGALPYVARVVGAGLLQLFLLPVLVVQSIQTSWRAISLDVADRERDDVPPSRVPWFLRVLAAAFGFELLVSVILIPWIILLSLLWFTPTEPPQAERIEPEEPTRFVFMEPRIERPPIQPRERFELSDRDRRAQAPAPAPDPKNDLPFSRGDTPERVEATQPEQARPAPEPPAPQVQPTPPPPQPEEQQLARNTPAPTPVPPRPVSPARPPLSGVLGDAVRNLSRYTQNHTFDNSQGGNTDSTGAIQFDSKGVDFGPWLRRFVAQVKRNWFVPLAAMNFHGRVVLQFYVHRNGSITDVRTVQPSSIESFNTAAVNAILGSNPTEPLPPEYPDDNVLFTVTFFYNEQPPR
ncbi:MAG TPA: TonB family protein [Vicinamibacterales bacterium]|nr:TonB family protein [Vicinamibacterales bacterium]